MQKYLLWLLVSITVLVVAVEILALLVVVDGLPSHAVKVSWSVARYYWYRGAHWRSLQTLGQMSSQVWISGLRWKQAQVYRGWSSVLAALGQQETARQMCYAALEVLEYGRYAHSQRGTSTFAGRC